MSQDSNTTLTHVYGVIGLVLGIVGLVISFKVGSPWSEMALFGSGWLVAIFLAILLIRDFNRSREDGEKIGRLHESIRALERELAGRNQTLDFIAGLHLTKTARPRVAKQPANDAAQQDQAGDAPND